MNICRMLVLFFVAGTAQADPVVIGSKTFAESYILSEAAAQLLESKGFEVDRRFGLNGTSIAFEALQNEAIDLYPEYTGTITEVILKQPELRELSAIRTGAG